MRVDFYLPKEDEPQEIGLVACDLLEKAYLQKHRVFVFCNDQTQAETLDELLWTFKEESFIPHNLQGEGPEPPPPIQIGYGPEPRGFNDILLLMADTIPPFHTRFNRIMVIVPSEEAGKAIHREHYKYFKSQGYTLEMIRN